MKRKDDARPSSGSTRVKTKFLEHPLKPTELPKRDKKRNLNLVEPVLRDIIPKKTKVAMSGGLKPERLVKDTSLRRATSQAIRLKQVKAWLGEASTKELDTLKNYLLKVRPQPAGEHNSEVLTGRLADRSNGAPLTVGSGNSVHDNPNREKEAKESGEDIFNLLFQGSSEPSDVQDPDPGDDRHQATGSQETPAFLGEPRVERPHTGSLHESLMTLARRRHGLV